MLEFQVKAPKALDYSSGMRQAIDRAGYNISKLIEEYAVEESPYQTGKLGQSIISGYDPETMTIWVGSNLEYAPHVEFGTQPHIIEPKTKKALKFETDGKTVFAKKVQHPGTSANPFIERAIKRVIPDIVEELKIVIGEVTITAKK